MTIEAEPTVQGNLAIQGACSCGAWFDLRARPSGPDFLGAAYYNGYPPCPAVAYAHRFEEELSDAS